MGGRDGIPRRTARAVTADLLSRREPDYEEIDRFGVGFDGTNNLLSRHARFDFFRAIPSSGYTKGQPGADELDSAPERAGVDFFAYYPHHLRSEPTTENLARATNLVQRALSTGDYLGAQWLEGSPTVEESVYWLDLLIDTPAAHRRPRGPATAQHDQQ